MNELAAIAQGLDDYLTVDRVALIYFVFNCGVQALPEPNGGKFYQFIFRFAHLIAGNTNVVRKQVADAHFHQGERRPDTATPMG